MTTTFENVKVGDRVYHAVSDTWGTISEKDSKEWIVKLDGERTAWLSIDGRNIYDVQIWFWDKPKVISPKQPVRYKNVNGFKVPDLSFTPKEGEDYYFPDPSYESLHRGTKFAIRRSFNKHRLAYGMCYPSTSQGRQAAKSHALQCLEKENFGMSSLAAEVRYIVHHRPDLTDSECLEHIEGLGRIYSLPLSVKSALQDEQLSDGEKLDWVYYKIMGRQL